MSIQSQDTTATTPQQTTEQDSVWKKRRRLFETSLNPFPEYRILRETEPVSYDEERQWWEVFRYQDVQHVITDYATFSSEQVIKDQDFPRNERAQQDSNEQDQGEFVPTLVNVDPPRHRQLRSLITQAFTPRAVAQMAPRITAIVNEQLDTVVSTGRMDVIEDLSYPLPVIVIAEMLGIPSEQRAQFKRWSDDVLSSDEKKQGQAVKEMNSYFRSVIAERRVAPRDDLISALVAAQLDGEKLTEPELLSFCVLLLIAGNITTTNLIGNAILCFDDHPEVMDELRADPSLMPGAIEEILRYLSPVQRLIRAATVDTVIGDKQIKAGQLVVPCLGSANRDETQFTQPDVFDIRRTPNRHLAFGHSIHFCIGAPLARLESRIALEVMLQRFTEIKRAREIPLETVSAFLGVKSLPITFKGK
jgi:cytochrome P450